MSRITLEEHSDFANLCSTVRRELMEDVRNYKTKKEQSNSLESRALKRLEALQDSMDSLAFKDYHERAHGLYYGRG